MNFDIKYTKYLQIFNFIKIKQVLSIILGIQSWEYLAKIQDQAGCNLGTLSPSADMWGPSVSDRNQERRKKGRKYRFTGAVHHLTRQVDPMFSLFGSHAPRLCEIKKRKGAGF